MIKPNGMKPLVRPCAFSRRIRSGVHVEEGILSVGREHPHDMT